MSNSPASSPAAIDPFDAVAQKVGATAAAPARDPFDDAAAKFAKPAGPETQATAAPAPTPAPTPETPSAVVNRLQSKIDDGSATDAERNQWLDARTSDLHQTSLAGRIARTIHDAPYGQILPEIGGWLKSTASNAIDTGKKIAPAFMNPLGDGNMATAGKALGSAVIGAVAEGGSIGKGALSLGANVVNAANNLNPFSPSSDFASRTQAQHELNTADRLRTIDPAAVKALAPDQAAAGTGGAAVDVAAAFAGGPETAAKAAIEPEQISLLGSEAVKASKQSTAYEKMIAAAQKAADTAPDGNYKAALQYGADAIKQVPVAGKVAQAVGTAGKAALSAGKAVAGTVADVATSPLVKRAVAGAGAGGLLSAAGAPPGESAPALAQGIGAGALVGAVRDPAILGAVNGVKEPPGLALKPNEAQPPMLATPTPAKAPLSLGKPPAPTETAGPPPPNPAGVDAANAARPPSAPLSLGTTPPSTQPVSRFSGGTEAVGGILDAARQGNAILRAKAIGGAKPSPELVASQQALSDKPLATVGPVAAGAGDPEALKASQALGNALTKQPAFDAFLNNLFGGNRGGSGTPTTQIRIHDMPDGSSFTSAGVKAQVIRPPGSDGVTIVRTDNPDWPDISVHKPIEGKYAFPTDTGPQEIARIDKDNPAPVMLGGEPHQILASRGKTDPVTLGDASGNKKVMASRTLLNADAPTVEQAKAPVPMTPVANSSNIESYGYDAPTQTLYVKAKGTNNIYAHPGIDIETAKAMDAAESKGKFYNAIKKDFPAE